MGATGALYAWGFKYEAEPGSYQMEGVVNSPEAIEALEFYKELYDCCTPPGTPTPTWRSRSTPSSRARSPWR
jgi:multiple sugar transport system substrate-binding protein